MLNFQNTALIGPYAHGGPVIDGKIKSIESDFIVIEELSYDLEGEGEHVYCYVSKQSVNTEYVASSLAKFANVPRKQVNYAGLKDKQALTEQWFSVHIPGKITPDFTAMVDPNFHVIKQKRHLKKLQRGALKGNHFTIRLRDISGDFNLLEKRIQSVKTGVPNYFGLQRFGVQAQNLVKAQGLFFDNYKIRNKQLKGLIFSAVRSWIFNIQLANRLENGTWDRLIEGDFVNLTGSNSVFVCEELTPELVERSTAHELGPAGILWGKCDNDKFSKRHECIKSELEEKSAWLDALEARELVMMTRPFVCMPHNFIHSIEGNELVLSFFLRKGSYATVLIREILKG